MIYINIFIILLILAVNYDFLNRKLEQKTVYWVVCLVLILFSSIRYRVGGDTINYMITYEYIPSILEENFFEKFVDQRAEIGWYILSGLCKIVSDDFVIVQIVQAAIVNLSMFFFINRYTKYKFVAILFYYILFFLYSNFEILRESLAICIFILYGIKYLLSKKYFKYFITCIIAFMFHTSAIILLVVPIIFQFVEKYRINYSIYFSLLYFIGTLLSSSFYDILSGGIFNIFSNKYETYLDYEFTIFGRIMAYLLYVLIPLYIYSKIDHTPSKFNQLLIVYSFVGALSGFFPIFFRFINYFTPILIVCFTFITISIYSKRNSSLRFENSILFILFITVFFNYKIINVIDVAQNIRWYSRWYPYHTIFDKQEDAKREYIWQKQFNN